MEIWSLLDRDGQETGETLERGQPIPAGRYHQIIGVWTIHRHLRKVLITLRAPQKSVCPNRWENTGGSIVLGESVAEGAAREVVEETGLDCVAEDLDLIARLRTEKEFVYCFIHYTNSHPEGIKLQALETVAYRWVDLIDIDALIQADAFARPEIAQYRASRDALEEALAKITPENRPVLKQAKPNIIQDVDVRKLWSF